MTRAIWAFAIAAVVLAGVLTWVIFRGEDTRSRVDRVVDPCRHPQSESCQRRIRLVLRELVRRHPTVLKELGLTTRDSLSSVAPGGGGLANPPSGGGPTGRVRRPRPPAPTPPNPPEPEPLLDLETPSVCVGDLVRVNCD